LSSTSCASMPQSRSEQPNAATGLSVRRLRWRAGGYRMPQKGLRPRFARETASVSLFLNGPWWAATRGKYFECTDLSFN
jgi:hypothetical protein